MKVPFSYLDRQFQKIDSYLEKIRSFVQTGNFTLDNEIEKFENRFAKFCKAPFAIGVNSGTDALAISLKMLGIEKGDEVITTPMTSVSTFSAIIQVGAVPVLVDSEDGFVIDPDKIEQVVTEKTKAIVPVHYSGNVADMPRIRKIADEYQLIVVEDACQAIGGEQEGKPIGTYGHAACFSFHPLQDTNIWSDAGVIITHSEELAEKARLYRNHGLISRDEVMMFGVNSRFDTIQAVVANQMMEDIDFITNRRIKNAKKYDSAFSQLREFISIPQRRRGVKHVFHSYMIRALHRDLLLEYLQSKGVECKIHCPIPMHLQRASEYLGYKDGNFSVCEKDCKSIITLPSHQHLTNEELEYVIEQVRNFYQVDRPFLKEKQYASAGSNH